MLRVLGCVTGQHDVWLVVVAGLVCALTCITALNLLGRGLAAGASGGIAWYGAAAVAFGGGVWATHFVAMLAYRPGIPFAFLLLPTAVSLVLPMLGGLLAFALLAYARSTKPACLGAGMLLGTSVAVMHFTGMAALQVAARVQFDTATCVVAFAIGVTCAPLALLAHGRGRSAVAAALLVLAVCGMHFTAMSAVTLIPGGIASPSAVAQASGPLANGVGLIAILILAFSLSASLIDGRYARRLEIQAHHRDPLTGLANRARLCETIAQALAQANRTRRGLALLCLDLDGFKAVNEMLGQSAGDRLLQAVALRLGGDLRQMDTVARIGGDEFAILQPLTDRPQDGAALAERVVRSLAQPFLIGGHSIGIGATVGIALFPADASSPQDLLRAADLALDRAKGEGKGTYRFFEPGMDAQMRARHQLEHDLRHALASDGLTLFYQAQHDCRTLEPVGCEALLRWHHPTLGLVPPAVFVPIAEASGLIRQLSQWVLETACRKAASWPRPLRVAVNLSPAEFKWLDLPQRVLGVLARTGLAPERLELEITEGVLIEDTERALAILRELKAHGVRFALDDFGTGFSSLGYLRRFRCDALKIDKSFVQAIGEDAEADAIIRAIVALAHSLNLDVIAEGVETPQQLAHLRAQNCDRVQGFLLARPVPADQLEHSVRQLVRAGA